MRQHIAACPECREDYEEQLRVCEAMRADGPLVFAAESSYQKLLARMQNPEAEPAAPRGGPGVPALEGKALIPTGATGRALAGCRGGSAGIRDRPRRMGVALVQRCAPCRVRDSHFRLRILRLRAPGTRPLQDGPLDRSSAEPAARGRRTHHRWSRGRQRLYAGIRAGHPAHVPRFRSGSRPCAPTRPSSSPSRCRTAYADVRELPLRVFILAALGLMAGARCSRTRMCCRSCLRRPDRSQGASSSSRCGTSPCRKSQWRARRRAATPPPSAYGVSASARAMTRSLERDYRLREVSAWPIESLRVNCIVARVPEPDATYQR